jgi:hypothetical protein
MRRLTWIMTASVLLGACLGAAWANTRHRVTTSALDERYFVATQRWICVHAKYGTRADLVRAAERWSSTRAATTDPVNKKGTALAVDAARTGRATGCADGSD